MTIGNAQEQISSSSAPAREFIFLDTILVLAKRRRLIGQIMLVSVIATAIVVTVMPQTFTATSVMLPPQPNQTSALALLAQLNPLAAGLGKDLGLKNPADLYVAMLKSRTIADDIINQFDLRKVYNISTYQKTRKKLADRTYIRATKEGVIELSVDDRDPVRAADLANAYVVELQKIAQSLAVTEASQRRLFFENQLLAAKNQLAEAEVALRKTQEETGLIQLDGQAKAIISAVASLKGKIAAKEIQIERMRMFATEQNPDLQAAERELSGLRNQLAQMERREVAGHGDIQLATAKVPAAGLEYIRQYRNVKYREAIFELLAKQFEVAKLDEAKNAVIVQVLDSGIPPERRSSPQRLLVIGISILLSFVLGSLAALLLDSFERMRADEYNEARFELLRMYLSRRGARASPDAGPAFRG